MKRKLKICDICSSNFASLESLSTREAEVAKLVMKAMSNKEIASALDITEKTVKFHLTTIYKKNEVRDRSQFIVKNRGK